MNAEHVKPIPQKKRMWKENSRKPKDLNRTGKVFLFLLRRFLFGSVKNKDGDSSRSAVLQRGGKSASHRTGSRRQFKLARLRGGILGISLSLIPLVLVYNVANGMIAGITLRYIETGTYHLQLRGNNNLREFEAMLDPIRDIEDIEHAFLELRGLGLLAGGRGNNGVEIRGVDPQIYTEDRNFAQYLELIEGDFDLDAERNIVVGEGVANVLGLEVGMTVRLVTARINNDRITPRVSRFTVKGIVSSGYRDLDSLWVFIPFEDALRIIPTSEALEILGIKVKDPFILEPRLQGFSFLSNTKSAPETLDHLSEVTEGRWRIFTWYDLEEGQYTSFITTRNILVFIMILILILATLNISSTMFMLVTEKQEEIAILKSIGTRNHHILALVLSSGGITGIIGSIIGLTLGVIATYNVNNIIHIAESIINGITLIASSLNSKAQHIPIQLFNPEFYLTTIPVHIRAIDILIMFLLTIVLSIFMSYLPARRAVRLRPLDLLYRH